MIYMPYPPVLHLHTRAMAYDLQPDNVTFSPGIEINYTVPQARWGQEFVVKTFDTTSGTLAGCPYKVYPEYRGSY